MRILRKAGAVFLTGAAMFSCVSHESAEKTYLVRRVREPIPVNADWDKFPWKDIQPLDIGLYMGEKPEHFPLAQAKAAYDEDNIYLIFRVEDNYIKAAAKEHQTPVCIDSCVEFFFAPSTDLSAGYMNLEINCLGTMLFAFQKERGVGRKYVSREDLSRIETAHSLPYDLIVEEIQEPTTWILECRLPLEVIENYIPVEAPSSGVEWRANFYKCADETSKPHWLTWSFVDSPKPQFHAPECFGTLLFE